MHFQYMSPYIRAISLSVYVFGDIKKTHKNTNLQYYAILKIECLQKYRKNLPSDMHTHERIPNSKLTFIYKSKKK